MNSVNNKGNRLMFYIACLVSVGGILYGYDMGVISGALLFIKNTIPMSDAQTGIIVGAVLAGGLIGTLLAGPIGDYFGRRFLIGSSSLIFILGVGFILISKTFITLLIARLLLGIGVGVIAVGVPLYVAEIVPSKDRGKYVTFFQLLLTFGILLSYFVDLLFTDSGNWRAMFGLLLIPAVILFLGIFLLPETPRWLMINNKPEQARKILEKLRPSAAIVNHELALITENINCHSSTKSGLKEFLSPHLLFPSFVAVSIATCNQLTGINCFLQYAPIILKNAGIDSDQVSMFGSAGIGLLNFLFTIIAITLIDSLGRRPLLLAGVLGVFIAEIYLGSINYFIPNSPNAGVLSLIGLLFFIICFAIGPGIVVWLVISELFPTHVRGKGVALCLFFNSLASTALATLFLPLVKFIGMGQTYWLFAFFSFLYFLIAYFFLPETKEKTLEQIQDYFVEQRGTA